MGQVVTSPTETEVQVSARSPAGGWTLTVLAKRTYAVDDQGRLTPSAEQPGFVLEPRWDEARPDILRADVELLTPKPRTDVVVHGHVHGDGAARKLIAEVAVAGRKVRIQAFGARRCSLAQVGGIVFSTPAPIERVPLDFTRSYGGRDAVYEAVHGNPARMDPALSDLTEAQLDAASPYLYPRNPIGCGYLIEPTREALEALELPQLEDPADPLTPTRLAVPDPRQWYRMPLPQGTGLIDYDWYPRIAYLGVVPICARFDAPPAEVTRGLVHAGLAAGDGRQPPEFAYELACAAAPALQFPLLRGGEPVKLAHMHPRRTEWSFNVPPAPAMAIDARDGTVRAVQTVLHTLQIEPDEGRVTLIWRGDGPALRRYMPDELKVMPMRVAWAP